MFNVEVVYQKEDCVVAVCPIISDKDYENIDISLFPKLKGKSKKRQREWITSHQLLAFILGQPVTYCYNIQGKPVLNKRSEKISITHSGNYCAVIVNKSNPVGIDIEEPSDRIFKIADRFLTVAEKAWVDESQNKTEILYLIWCVKEAMYKLTDTKPDFKENLFVEKTDLYARGIIKARLEIGNLKTETELHYNKSEKYTLVYTV